MNTIKTWRERGAEHGPIRARDAEIAELRAALEAAETDLEEWRFTNKVDELQRQLEGANQAADDLRATLAKQDAQMLRMAQCAGELAKDSAQSKPKPSTLGQQVKQAQKEWAKMSPEKRASVKLEGSSSLRPPSKDKPG